MTEPKRGKRGRPKKQESRGRGRPKKQACNCDNCISFNHDRETHKLYCQQQYFFETWKATNNKEKPYTWINPGKLVLPFQDSYICYHSYCKIEEQRIYSCELCNTIYTNNKSDHWKQFLKDKKEEENKRIRKASTFLKEEEYDLK